MGSKVAGMPKVSVLFPARDAGPWVEQALASGSGPRDAAAHAAEGTSPSDDLNAPRAYREHLARVLVGRALEESSSRA